MRARCWQGRELAQLLGSLRNARTDITQQGPFPGHAQGKQKQELGWFCSGPGFTDALFTIAPGVGVAQSPLSDKQTNRMGTDTHMGWLFGHKNQESGNGAVARLARGSDPSHPHIKAPNRGSYNPGAEEWGQGDPRGSGCREHPYLSSALESESQLCSTLSKDALGSNGDQNRKPREHHNVCTQGSEDISEDGGKTGRARGPGGLL